MENSYTLDISYVLICGVIGILLIISPYSIVLLLFGWTVAMVTLELIKLNPWQKRGNRRRTYLTDEKPMVSVHLAICNEPSEMVIRTIESILAQDYPNFEIIVIDNNTRDKRLWKPVESYCSSLENVRFFHLRNWPYYKSGALNFARKVTASEAEHIFVIDADYNLERNALSAAVENAISGSIALVQFPQAYIMEHRSLVPILNEFDHFFDYHCRKADSCHGALAPGTLSLIRLEALDAIGGWPTDSITEDAELGSRLQSAGYDIKYVHRVIGRGIVPVHQSDFLKQRKRWIFGNIQTLLRYSIRPITNFRKWSSGISQLTAWINLMGFPVLCLISCLLFFPVMEKGIFLATVRLSLVTYWIYVLAKFFQYLSSGTANFRDSANTFLISLSTLGIGAFHWWPVLLGRERPFERTDKTNLDSDYLVNMFYPLLNFLVAMSGIIYDSPFITISASVFFCLHLAATWRDCSLRTRKVSRIKYDIKLHL